MAAAMNGMALHGGVIPYSGTFLVFADYSRPAIRLGALMGVAGDPRDDPRLHRPGRGRPDPPAGRAPGLPARHAQPAGLPPRRRGGDRRVLEAGAGGQDHARRSWPCRARRPRRCARPRPPRTCRPRAPTSSPPPTGEAQVTIFASGTEVGDRRGRARRCCEAEGIATRVVSTPCWELFDAADRRLPQAAVIGDGRRPRRRRGRRPPGLGAVHRRGRRLRRHDRLRRQRPVRAALQGIRHHRRSGGRSGEGEAGVDIPLVPAQAGTQAFLLFCLNSRTALAVDQEKSLGPRLRGGERLIDAGPPRVF